MVVVSDATTVLLIDDAPRYRDHYAQRLYASASHYDVVHAATGRSGLDILAKLVPRTYRPEIAVIVLTRLPNRFLLDLAIKNGAQAALQKTVGSDDLLEHSMVKAVGKLQVLNKIVT